MVTISEFKLKIDDKNKASNGIYDVVIVSLPIYKEDVFTPFTEINRNSDTLKTIQKIIKYSDSAINESGILYIYGSPIQLIYAYQNLPKEYRFRYWIALDMLDSLEKESSQHLKHNHLGILMVTKGDQFPHIDTKSTRVPYSACSFCGKNVKDWGGKKHLMNLIGTGISDIWKDFYKVETTKKDPYNPQINLNVVNTDYLSFSFKEEKIPQPILERLYDLSEEKSKNILLVKVNKNVLTPVNKVLKKTKVKFNTIKNISKFENKVLLGDCIEEMEKIVKKNPDGVFDLVFADPPYNLQKAYKVYDDSLIDKEYIEWCDRWLELCVKVTKPTGSIFILNIPKWSLEHVKELNKHAYLQNWIIWDALSTPKGKIMPAHYTLLYYTKSASGFTFNPLPQIDSPGYCLRAGCIDKRRSKDFNGHTLKLNRENNKKTPISDIWWNVHRIKHKKNRDDHPCQLPDKLMDRIVKMFSNEGDLVFDPFAGAGTTAIWAVKNSRNYCTIEIDPLYKKITEKKLAQVKTNGHVVREVVQKKYKSIYTKKFLELKVQEFSQQLGRRPTFDEFISRYSLNAEEIGNLYEDPKRVLKAGRISLLNGSY